MTSIHCEGDIEFQLVCDLERDWWRFCLTNCYKGWSCSQMFDSEDFIKYEEPTSLFEHFVIAGIHPDANLEVVEDEYAERKKLEFQVEKSSLSAVEPQILFKYPPGKRVAMRLKDLPAFCFPGGVKDIKEGTKDDRKLWYKDLIGEGSSFAY